MSRPRKRPRLQIIGSESPEPDFELEAARRENDQVLKARWEDIFERYGRDFTGVGDEIGLLSGRIEVDNGHLRNLHDEPDSNEEQPEQSKFNGRRMLRAMTVASSDYSGSVSEDEDVFQSIETIASNAMLSGIDSEDDLAQEQSEYQEEHSSFRPHGPLEIGEDALKHNAEAQGYSMNTSRHRSSSPDSLFDVEEGTQRPLVTSHPESEQLDLRTRVIQILQEEKAQALERKEEEIEPAWRLPIHISSLTPSMARISSPARGLRQHQYDVDHVSDSEASQQQMQKPKRKKTAASSQSTPTLTEAEELRRSQKAVAAEKNIRKIRADSEDPLQEGFSSLAERQHTKKSYSRKDSVPATNHSRFASNSAYLVTHEEGESESESDFERTELEAGRKRQRTQSRDDRRALIAKYRPKPAGKSNARANTPRFSATETDVDKTTHPWHVPATRDGKPLNFKAAAQRKSLNAKFSTTYTGTRDPVSEKLRRDKVLKPMERGICIYCNNNHTNKNGVGSHWDRVLTNFVAETLDKNDPHDIEFIHEIRRKVERRIRPPVTRLLDFTTMVKMHEGQGKSFGDILKSNLLFTTKTAPQLETEFRVWRQSPEERQGQHQWTDAQVDHLQQLMKEVPQSSRNSLTLIRIHKLVGSRAGMGYSDIGNKIADLIMQSGDLTIRLPMQPLITTDQEPNESTRSAEQRKPAEDRSTTKSDEEVLIDPKILDRTLSLLGEGDFQKEVEDASQGSTIPHQSQGLSDVSGSSDLYQQLASYANGEQFVVDGSSTKPTGPIDMAPRL